MTARPPNLHVVNIRLEIDFTDLPAALEVAFIAASSAFHAVTDRYVRQRALVLPPDLYDQVMLSAPTQPPVTERFPNVEVHRALNLGPRALSSLPPAQQVDGACTRLREVGRWIEETFAGLPSGEIGDTLSRLAESLEKGWADRVVADKLQGQADAMRGSLGNAGRMFSGEFGDVGVDASSFATADGGLAPAGTPPTPTLDMETLAAGRVVITPIPGAAEAHNRDRFLAVSRAGDMAARLRVQHGRILELGNPTERRATAVVMREAAELLEVLAAPVPVGNVVGAFRVDDVDPAELGRAFERGQRFDPLELEHPVETSLAVIYDNEDIAHEVGKIYVYDGAAVIHVVEPQAVKYLQGGGAVELSRDREFAGNPYQPFVDDRGNPVSVLAELEALSTWDGSTDALESLVARLAKAVMYSHRLLEKAVGRVAGDAARLFVKYTPARPAEAGDITLATDAYKNLRHENEQLRRDRDLVQIARTILQKHDPENDIDLAEWILGQLRTLLTPETLEKGDQRQAAEGLRKLANEMDPPNGSDRRGDVPGAFEEMLRQAGGAGYLTHLDPQIMEMRPRDLLAEALKFGSEAARDLALLRFGRPDSARMKVSASGEDFEIPTDIAGEYMRAGSTGEVATILLRGLAGVCDRVTELEASVEAAASRIEVDSESDSIDDRFAAAAEAARLLRRAL